jgi:hypothetical protein
MSLKNSNDTIGNRTRDTTKLSVAKLLTEQQQTEQSGQLAVNLLNPSDILTTFDGTKCSHFTSTCPSDHIPP